jgi:hypothetical protein
MSSIASSEHIHPSFCNASYPSAHSVLCWFFLFLAAVLSPYSSQNILALTCRFPLTPDLPLFAAPLGSTALTDSRMSSASSAHTSASASSALKDYKEPALRSGGQGVPELTVHNPMSSAASAAVPQAPLHRANYMCALSPLRADLPTAAPTAASASGSAPPAPSASTATSASGSASTSGSAAASSASASAPSSSAVSVSGARTAQQKATDQALSDGSAKERLISELNVLRGSKLLAAAATKAAGSKTSAVSAAVVFDRFDRNVRAAAPVRHRKK